MSVLIKPLITEKMTSQSEKLNKYGFVVSRSANKVEIKKEVEKSYGVSVDSICTLTVRGKAKSRYTKAGILSGSESTFKKAIVTLAAGDTIDFYSNI